MILTTTPAIEGHTIWEYKGVVFGEVITGVNFIKDFAASIRNIVGGRSGLSELGISLWSFYPKLGNHPLRESPGRTLLKGTLCLTLKMIN